VHLVSALFHSGYIHPLSYVFKLFVLGYQSKDVLLPYCSDDRLHEDTLFFVAEQDFRFYAVDETVKFGHLDLRGDTHTRCVIKPSSAPSRSLGPVPEPFAEPRPKLHSQPVPTSRLEIRAPSSFSVLNQSIGGSAPELSRELSDLVHICNDAHRRSIGNLVWLCWCGANKRAKKKPSHGSTLIALTKAGAKRLMANFEQAWSCLENPPPPETFGI
jgi:hypothetical protein